jgi:hypothetical protein
VPDATLSAILGRPFPQQVAFFRGKLGQLVPTERWTDLLHNAHDRAFMVAGAQQADLLAGLAAAVDRAVTEGVSLDTFRRDFAALVERSGWSYRGEFNWRTRTIYRTNLSSSYAAGRSAQLLAGNFPFYMYKHGGSLDPRPEHLAWDGIFLPADHPFWRTHFAPNGWGCTCRIIGLRRREDARALGGDPDKTLPEGWDAIDPSTGTPPGIDPGWAYRPGDTVSDTVRAMAAKTQQWEYALAKAFMESVPAGVRDRLATAYRDLPSVANATRLYAQRIVDGQPNPAPYHTLGLVTSAQGARMRAAFGIEADGFDFALDQYAPKHILKQHGDSAAEMARGQRAVETADYLRLPELLNAPDAMRATGESWSSGQPVIEIRKRFDSDELVTVWEQRKGRKTLALVSMWWLRGAAP